MSLCVTTKPPSGAAHNSTQARCAPECASQVHFSVSTEELRKYSSGAIWGGKVSLCGLGEQALSAGKEKGGRKLIFFFSPN